MAARLISLLIGYLLGCFLTADVVSRKMAGRPAFDLGVGNPGMANVGHELGTRAAAIVLAGDILKTLAAWLIARALFPADAAAAGLWAGLGATLGHDFPFWHRFRGGKGVTTTCSAIILASPGCGIAAAIAGFAVVLLSGYLCLGGIAIPAIFTLLMLLAGRPEHAMVAAVLMLLAIRAHGPAALGIRNGKTLRAGIADALRAKLGR